MEKSVFKCKVEPRNVDFTSRATVSSMCDIILYVAGRDAHNRGFGIQVLADKNFGWVLSRLCIELDYMPREYDEFTVHTWISDYNRLSSTRNFTLTDGAGREFGRAVTQWCMLDYDTRMPVDMKTLEKVHDGTIVDCPSPCERPRRLGAVKSEPILEHKVAYSDIDFNRHMNTMRYIDLIFDTMPIEVPEKLEAVRMDINFLREALYGDLLSLKGECSDTVRTYEFANEAGDALCRFAFEIR
ncbi:MAG: acyl-ACP thioesterase [Alistipes sp.]|nr:acyl-ACP thioesterase [Alistipes sp.]